MFIVWSVQVHQLLSVFHPTLLWPLILPPCSMVLACVSMLGGGEEALMEGGQSCRSRRCLWSLSEQSLNIAAPISFDPEGIDWGQASLHLRQINTDTHIHTQSHQWKKVTPLKILNFVVSLTPAIFQYKTNSSNLCCSWCVTFMLIVLLLFVLHFITIIILTARGL